MLARDDLRPVYWISGIFLVVSAFVIVFSWPHEPPLSPPFSSLYLGMLGPVWGSWISALLFVQGTPSQKARRRLALGLGWVATAFAVIGTLGVVVGIILDGAMTFNLGAVTSFMAETPGRARLAARAWPIILFFWVIRLVLAAIMAFASLMALDVTLKLRDGLKAVER